MNRTMVLAGWTWKRWAALALMTLAVAIGALRALPLFECPRGPHGARSECFRCQGSGSITPAERMLPTRHGPCTFDLFGNPRELHRLLSHFEASGVHGIHVTTPWGPYSGAALSQVLLVLLVLVIWLWDPLLFPVQQAPESHAEAVAQRAHRISWIRARRRLRTGAAAAIAFLVLVALLQVDLVLPAPPR